MRRSLLFLLLFSFTYVKSQAQCNAAFTYNISNATVQLQASHTGTNFLHRWYFGDGHTGYGINTSHTYNAPGVYNIKQVVSDSLGTCTDSTIISVTIHYVPCNAQFTFTPNPSQQTHYFFNALSAGNGHTYQWKIDNTPVSTLRNFNQVLTPGTHQICLLVMNPTGCSASACIDIFVVDSAACTWSASFTHTASLANPKQLSFFPNITGPGKSYQWNFYQMNQQPVFSSDVNPVITYAAAGNYPVRLAIFDSTTGCFDTAWQSVQVHGTAADSCTLSFNYTTQQNQVSFTTNSNQQIVSQTWYLWAFDSSLNVTLQSINPTYTFPDSGSYSVCVYAVTSSGCSASACQTVTVTGQRPAEIIPSFPNPANGSDVNLRFTMQSANRIRITVYNTSGNIVYENESFGVSGLNTINIPIDRFQRGQYFVNIQYGNEQKRSIFQKL